MKKVLILTVTAGNGHNACAYAMKKQLENLDDVTVEVVDIIKEYSTPLTKFIVDKGYCFAVSKLPKIYNKFYDKYREANPFKRYKCSAQGAALSTVNGIYKKICEFEPDVIYCTHFYGAIALSDLKLIYNLPCKCIASILDFVISPFWEAGVNIDYLTIPNGDFTNELLFKGYERSKLLPLGIPCKAENAQFDKLSARQKLNLDEDSFIVLTMFGGGYWKGGFKLFKDILNAVGNQEVQIIVINGKNKRNFKKIAKLQKKTKVKILNVGFTENVPLYLAAADVAVTKCGGISSSEMLNAGLPMIVTENIPAQELYNLQYLKDKNAALSFKNADELKNILDKVIKDNKISENMRDSALQLKTCALNDLAKFIIDLPDADYTTFNKNIKRPKKAVKKAMYYAYYNEQREF